MRDIQWRAEDALLYEISVTPKPGLVDLRNSGSHADMDVALLTKSAAFVAKAAGECHMLGAECAFLPANDSFSRLRRLGASREAELMKLTGGVNTHKGALFCLGLLAFSIGRLGRLADSAAICAEAGHICRDTLTSELENRPISENASNGERARALNGMTGARGEAAAGFPSVLNVGIPRYLQALSAGVGENAAGVWALLWLMTLGNDTCLFARGGRAGVTYASEAAKSAVAGGLDGIEAAAGKMDGEFIARRLSAGGCADMLAATRFLAGSADISKEG